MGRRQGRVKWSLLGGILLIGMSNLPALAMLRGVILGARLH